MPLTPPRRLELPDLVLRPWTVTDAAALRSALAASDAHLRAWTPWVIDGRVPGQSLEERLAQHEAAFAAGTEWVYGLFHPDGGEVLGACGIFPRVGPRAVELGYWLAVGQTGRGYATRSAGALTRVAFVDPDIDHVEIRCEPGNVASVRVAERLGYRLAGTVEVGSDELQVFRLSRAEFAAGASAAAPRRAGSAPRAV